MSGVQGWEGRTASMIHGALRRQGCGCVRWEPWCGLVEVSAGGGEARGTWGVVWGE